MGSSYQEFLQESMLEFVKKILARIYAGDERANQIVYISYQTDHPLVQLPYRIKERYPKEITIVLQHQFENLNITEKGFSVVLSFDGVREVIYVPFDALTNFSDPNNGYNLKFQPKLYTPKVMKQELSYDKKSNKHVPLPSDFKDEINSADNVIVLDKFRKPSKIT